MSQHSVERVIGVLATDEALRRRFRQDPRGVLVEMIEGGMQLNTWELKSLLALDAGALARFAEALDPRLQKSDLEGGRV